MANLTSWSSAPYPYYSDKVAGNLSAVVDEDEMNAPFVNDETRFYFELCIQVLANAAVSIFGTVANIINIVVYAKMGLGDVVNVSLLGLAVSDLLSVITVVWLCICYSMFLINPSGLVFDPMSILYVTAGWPHFIFSRVTCYITAMVSIERCLCVIIPFKVKEIITPRRIKVCLVVIFTAFPAAYIPVLMVHRLTWKHDPNHNETRIMADFTEDRDRVQAISYFVNDIVLPTLSIVIVTLCTVLIARSLQINMQWKQKTKVTTKKESSEKGDSKTNSISAKEMKVVRMLVLISIMFVICYSPTVLLLYIRIWIPELDMWKRYHNLFMCIYSLVFFLEISNSSVNIIVYYVMSSKYRTTFLSIFWKSRLLNNDENTVQTSKK